ncbi:MAG: zinc ribbon domain-containing protein [Candidatus Paceibacterota bacterium]|jgi:hypothetical protein
MFCEHCGSKIEESYKFCTKCGSSAISLVENHNLKKGSFSILDDRWWHRLLKVFYIFLYIQILWIVPAVWSSNSSVYVGSYRGGYHYENTYWSAFWCSLLAIAIFMVAVRLIKITVLYIVIGRKPEWKKEFKKFF